jgi:hypothetical protein
MISKNSSVILAAMAALSLVWSSNALASDTNSSAAIEAVTKNDSMLRSALGSLEKSEKQLREKFDKELSALNEARLKALQQAFDRASSRRDTESVASLAAIINAMKSEGSAVSLAAKTDEVSLIGNWEFDYKGQPRRFRFAEDNTFEGQIRVSGRDYRGTWERSQGKILLTQLGSKDLFATVSISANGTAIFRQALCGNEMRGQKAD